MQGAGRETQPVNAGGKPGELFRRERPGGVAVAGPAEGALVQAAGAEPDAVAVPHQEFHAGAFFPGEEEGFAFPGRMPGGLSGESRQGVDAGAYVSRLADEPEGMRAQHRLSSRMMAAMPAGEAVTQAH